MRRTHITALLALSLLAADYAVAQPASALHPGSGAASNTPATSLHGPASVPAASGQPAQTWNVPAAASKATDVHATEPSALQKADLPADLARLSDSAIITVGGKPTTAGEVKRAVLSLDDKAIIIIGGRHVPAGEMKQQLQTGARKPAEAPAAKGRDKLESHVSSKPITTVSPRRRAAIAAQLLAIREDQGHLADAVARADARPNPATTPAGTSVWPQAPLGAKVLETSAMTKSFGIFAINGRTKNIQLTPGGKVAITGLGLGQPTDVKLVGGSLEHHPVLMRIVSRSPTRIDAEIPSTTRGSPDEPHASLVVSTGTGATYRFDGVSFVAAREDITITDGNRIAAFMVVMESAPSYPDPWTPNGHTGSHRSKVGKSIDCPAPGSDKIRFPTINGFTPIGATLTSGRTDSGDDDERGNPGSRVFTGAYGFGDWIDDPQPAVAVWIALPATVSTLTVNWGVFRSHSSSRFSIDAGVQTTPFPPMAYADAGSSDPHDHCSSDWDITSLTLYGPAGVTP